MKPRRAGRPDPPASPLRVAVAGASGIGRHHANWHAQVGGEVVAILGSRRDRCERTRDQLGQLFGFSGRAYTDLPELLRSESPAVVDVCTPNELHYDCAARALAAGSHVLCEKPLVWDPAAPADRLRRQARELCEQARHAGRHLGLCTQYAFALDHYRRVRPDSDPGRATTFEAELETLSRGSRRDAATVWIDMGSHPLSLILAAMPRAELDASSLRSRFGGRQAEAEFTLRQDGRSCDCRVVVRDRDEGPPLRRFAFDGEMVDFEGRPGSDGLYRAVLTAAGREDVSRDYMHRLIGQFHDAVSGAAEAPRVPAEAAARNLDLQLRILEAA